MDGYLAAIHDRLAKLEAMVFGPVADDSGHNEPAQTVDPRRMPAAPGLPMAPFLPDVHDEVGTQETIDAENDAKTRRPLAAMTDGGDDSASDTGIVPDDIYAENEDPTLNDDGTPRPRKRRSAS